MSKLNELIAELCPNGVEYKALEKCCVILDKKRKPITKSARTNGEYPYYGANGIQDYVDNYIFDGTYVLVGEDGSVITKRGTPVVTWATGKIWVNNHAHIIEELDGVSLRYLYHFLQTVDVTPLIHGNIPKLTGKDFKNIPIPVPPLPVQEEIVRILDSFTSLTAELQARQKQYEYYRDQLLTFDVRGEGTSEVQWKTLGELGKWSGGKTPSMAKSIFWDNGKIPWISSKDMKASTLSDTQDHITDVAVKDASMTIFPKNSIAIVTRSGILKHTFPVAYIPFETTINQDIKLLVVNDTVNPRYAFHLLQGNGRDILKKLKSKVEQLTRWIFKEYSNIKSPFPLFLYKKKL